MSEPIYIQIDDLVREATPEEAEAIRQVQDNAPTLSTAVFPTTDAE